MSETFTFDVTLTATVEVTADSVAKAVEALREMQGANPLITLFRGEHGTVDLNEVSLGPLESAGKYQGTTVRLAHLANGEPINLPMDDMDEPVICEQYEAGTQVADCHLVYDETRGDGYCGTCPACADAGLGAP
jgi:hypothetical protein